MEIIRADGFYAERMEKEAVPYLKEHCTEGFAPTYDGKGKLYYRHYRSKEGSATIVLLHGFTEGIDKFRETIFYFLKNGFHVWALQQREHGKSDRTVTERSLVCIWNYQDLIQDLYTFVRDLVSADPETDPDRLYLYGHSMGGGVGACFLENYPEYFSRAVLSSPMMQITSAPTPLWLARAVATFQCACGRGSRPMPGSHPFSRTPDFENSCSTCKERYDYWFRQQLDEPEYQMCQTPFATALQFLRLTRQVTSPARCSRVTAQVLLMQAGRDTMVLPEGQNKFIRQIGDHGKIVRFAKAKHEIYMSTDDILQVYWKEIMDFLKS